MIREQIEQALRRLVDMVFVPDDKLKGKMAKNGSVLQYMYSV